MKACFSTVVSRAARNTQADKSTCRKKSSRRLRKREPRTLFEQDLHLGLGISASIATTITEAKRQASLKSPDPKLPLFCDDEDVYGSTPQLPESQLAKRYGKPSSSHAESRYHGVHLTPLSIF